MTEKEFRKIVADGEITKTEKEKINEVITSLTNIICDNIPNYLEIIDICKLGSLRYATILKGENSFSIGIISNINKELSKQEKELITLNTLENILLLNLEEKTIIRKNTITLNYQNYNIELFLIDEKTTNIIEKLNNDYPLFRNTISILKENLKEQKIQTISDEILINLLGYSLKNYLMDNRYEGYIHAFISGIDDFLKGSFIDLDQRYYREFNKVSNFENKAEYTIINFDTGENLTKDINQNILNDYRKFRKTIQKLTSVVDIITNNKEINIDVSPKFNQHMQVYNWSYIIENINLNVTGGSYQELNLETKLDAITKAIFKSLKVITEKGFNKSTINISTKGINIFDEELDVNNETSSRIKSIKKYISENNLKVKFK